MSDCISIPREKANLILDCLYKYNTEIVYQLEGLDEEDTCAADAIELWQGDNEDCLECIHLLEWVVLGIEHEGVTDECAD